MLFESKVTLEVERHEYFDDKGRKYLSVSKLLEKLKNKFDAEKISYFSARKRLKEKGVDTTEENIREAQQIVLAEWKAKNKTSIDHGTKIHQALETYMNTTKIVDKELEPMIRGVSSYFVKYPVQAQEQVLYSDEYMIAGTADKVCCRTKGSQGIIDFFDFKTNLAGIDFTNKYDNFLKEPLEYIEDCNYNTYCLQLSLYSLMAERTHKRKIGRLAIVYIPPDEPKHYRIIPVPYMRYEALAVLEHFKDEILSDLGHIEEVQYEHQDFY